MKSSNHSNSDDRSIPQHGRDPLTAPVWPRPLECSAPGDRPIWQRWRAHQATQGGYRVAKGSGRPDIVFLFTASELERLCFLRWLLQTGRLTR
jgi:hypothetical protein